MSDILGVPHTLGLTDINSQILQENRGIEARNTYNKSRYTQSIIDKKTPKTKDDGSATTQEKETGAIGGTDIYELGGVARNVKNFVSKTPAEALGVPEMATALGSAGAAGAEGTSTGITLLDAGSTGLSNIVNAKAAPEADNAVTVLNAGSGGLNNLIQGKASEDVVYATHVNPEAAAIGNAGNLAKDSESIIKGAAPELGALGKATAGLQIGMGAYDAFEDISHRKIEGDGFQKASNIADMVGGGAAGLFALGTALDLTGVGAPVGMALQGIAGIAGLVGGVSDFLEDEKQKKAPAAAPAAAASAAAAAAPKPIPVMAFQATGSTGQEVKVN
tara:strand:- start:1218 stop:2216 length:999 start_codon:yes stop_codon:yes gene_type:complete